MKSLTNRLSHTGVPLKIFKKIKPITANFYYNILAFLSPFLVLFLWYIVAEQRLFPPQILVPPQTVWNTFINLFHSGELIMHLKESLSRLFFGFSIATVFGILFGIAYATLTTFRNYTSILFNVLYQIPIFVLIPIFILIFGIGEVFKILLIIKACFFPIALATADAVKNIPQHYIELGKIYKFKTWHWLKLIIFPSTLAPIISGLRIALGRAWLILVAVELLAAGTGIGQMMELARQMLRLDIVMVGVLMTGLIGFSLDKTLRLIEQRFSRYHTPVSGEKNG